MIENKLRSAFFACAAIWLIGGVAIQVAIHSGGNIYALLNLHEIVVTGFGSLTIILGTILFVRWVRQKYFQGRDRNFQRTASPKGSERGTQIGEIAAQDRWSALVKYDEEIRLAAQKLQPFGEQWVKELGKAYFALNEDRKYLPKIVERLLSEIEEERRARWANRFRITYESEVYSDASLEILREAEQRGFTLVVDETGTIGATIGKRTSYLRSNSDIQRFAKYELG